MYAGAASLGDIPNPVAWIREKVGEFLNLEARFTRTRAQAGEIIRTSTDPDVRRQAAEIGAAAYDDLVRWRGIRAKLRIGDEAAGLGIVPVVYVVGGAAVAASIAVTMVALFRRATAQERALELLAAGRVTEAQVAAVAGLQDRPGGVAGALSEATGLVRMALFGAAAVVAFKALNKRKGWV